MIREHGDDGPRTAGNMTRKFACTLLLASFLPVPFLLASPAWAGDTAERPAKPTKNAVSTKSRTGKPQTIWGIRWYPSLENAQKVASKNARKPRLVLWMRVLGDLKGKT